MSSEAENKQEWPEMQQKREGGRSGSSEVSEDTKLKKRFFNCLMEKYVASALGSFGGALSGIKETPLGCQSSPWMLESLSPQLSGC